MTRERAKELLPVIEAWANGEEVQWFDQHGSKWHDIRDPNWENEHSLWRVKPKPLEIWVVEMDYGGLVPFYERKAAEQYHKNPPATSKRIIKMREVVE